MHSRLVSVLISASVVLVGPVAAQELVAPVDTSHSALIRTMKSDLRIMVQKQKRFFARHQTYADSTSLAQVAPPSSGVVRIVSAGPLGWSGTLTVEGVSCGVYVGSAYAPNGAVLADGEPGCWFRRRDGVLVGV